MLILSLAAALHPLFFLVILISVCCFFQEEYTSMKIIQTVIRRNEKKNEKKFGISMIKKFCVLLEKSGYKKIFRTNR